MSNAVSVNARAAALVERLVADADALKIGVARGALGELLVDAGSTHPAASLRAYASPRSAWAGLAASI